MAIKELHIKEDSEHLKCRVTILDETENVINQFELPSLIGSNAISVNGNKAVFSTLIPDNTIYFYDLNENQIIWKYKNHSHNLVQGIEFDNNAIIVSTGKNIASMKNEYELKLNGTIPEDCQNQLDGISKIKELPLEEAIPGLMNFFDSEYRTAVLKSITELQSFTYDRKIIKHFHVLVKGLPLLLKSKDNEIFYLTWKLIRRVIAKSPELINTILPDILSRIKTQNTEFYNDYLYYLEELCRTNSDWIKNEISNLNEIVNNNKDDVEVKNAKNILELYDRKTEQIPQYQFPISKNKTKFSKLKTYKIKTKDHILTFSNNEIVARIGWTKPSKIVKLDSELNEKWKIVVDGRVRTMRSDSTGTVITESTFVKNEESDVNMNSRNAGQDGQFFSSLYAINKDGKIIWKLEENKGFISLIEITTEKILVWNDLVLSIQCLKREDGEKLWEKSFAVLLSSKYSMRTLHYSKIFEKFLIVRMLNEQKKPVVPSIISVLDANGNVISEFEDDGFPSKEQLQQINPSYGDPKGGIVISVEFPPPHYPIYHAIFSPDGENIIAAHYNGQVACWTLDGKLNWVFECKNKVKLGLSVTDDGLVSALCENGDYFLIENGKEIMHSILEIDFRNPQHVFSAGKYAALGYDKKIMFFDRCGKVGELEFQDKIRFVSYEPKERLLAVAAGPISVVQIEYSN